MSKYQHCANDAGNMNWAPLHIIIMKHCMSIKQYMYKINTLNAIETAIRWTVKYTLCFTEKDPAATMSVNH